MALDKHLVRNGVIGVFFHAICFFKKVDFLQKKNGKNNFTRQSKNNRHRQRIALFVSIRWNAGGKAVVVVVVWVGRWMNVQSIEFFFKKTVMDQSKCTHFPTLWSDVKSFTDDVLERVFFHTKRQLDRNLYQSERK